MSAACIFASFWGGPKASLETLMLELGNFVFSIAIDSSDMGNDSGHVLQVHSWRSIRTWSTELLLLDRDPRRLWGRRAIPNATLSSPAFVSHFNVPVIVRARARDIVHKPRHEP